MAVWVVWSRDFRVLSFLITMAECAGPVASSTGMIARHSGQSEEKTKQTSEHLQCCSASRLLSSEKHSYIRPVSNCEHSSTDQDCFQE